MLPPPFEPQFPIFPVCSFSNIWTEVQKICNCISTVRVIWSRINSQIRSLFIFRSFYLLFIYRDIVSDIGIISAGLDS